MPTVTLITGEAVESGSEAWRHECEARMVANLPSTQLRHEYVAAVERKRGPVEAKALRDTATAIRLKVIEAARALAAAAQGASA